MRECSRGVASRIQGRGALLRSLRGLIRRVDRFGMHRASTAAERAWSHALGDALEGAYAQSIKDPSARACLVTATRRADVARKVPIFEALR